MRTTSIAPLVRISTLITSSFILITVLLIYLGHSPLSSQSRRLSLSFDYFTHENVRTINGVVPSTSCALGTYRPEGNTNLLRVYGQRQDGCIACPKGSYGDTIGLTSIHCSGLCPRGTFSDVTGLVSSDQCKKCPPGHYGYKEGLSTETCSAKCPLGTYTDFYGALSVKDCKPCPAGYRGWQCTWAIQPRDDNIDTDHQHLEFFGLPKGFKDPYPKKRNRLRNAGTA